MSAENQKTILKWCSERKYAITKKETSQAFLYFALDVLNNEGHCAMLVSSGVLLNPGAKLFRSTLFSNICIKDVFNFIHIRKSFFKDAISPFLLIHFLKKSQFNTAVNYWSAKNTGIFTKTQAILFSKYDRALLIDQDLVDNKIWKINWFGRYADMRFIANLKHMKILFSLVDRNKTGRGYEKGKIECEEIKGLKTIIEKNFDRYSELIFDEPPKGFRRNGIIAAFYGNQRILVRKGIPQKGENRGVIICRYEKGNFCFNERVYALKLIDESENNYLSLLGILLSSFARYYFFHTVSGWGSWHDGISLEDELLQLPVPSNIFSDKAEKIILTTKELCYTRNISKTKRDELEERLDEYVFEIYEFTNQQRKIISDCCKVTIPFFYDPSNSIGTKSVIEKGNTQWITDYAKSFAEYWQPYLDNDETLRADLCTDLLENLIAIEFYIAEINDNWDLTPKDKPWQSILSQINEGLTTPYKTSKIFLEGIVQIIAEKSFIIIKRNEKRFWTKSLAYEDAESIMTKRILISNTKTGSTYNAKR